MLHIWKLGSVVPLCGASGVQSAVVHWHVQVQLENIPTLFQNGNGMSGSTNASLPAVHEGLPHFLRSHIPLQPLGSQSLLVQICCKPLQHRTCIRAWPSSQAVLSRKCVPPSFLCYKIVRPLLATLHDVSSGASGGASGPTHSEASGRSKRGGKRVASGSPRRGRSASLPSATGLTATGLPATPQDTPASPAPMQSDQPPSAGVCIHRCPQPPPPPCAPARPCSLLFSFLPGRPSAVVDYPLDRKACPAYHEGQRMRLPVG